MKDYASKCVACNGKIRITRGTKLYGDATAAMKKNEAQREEARRAEGLEQAHMVMKDGELRAAYKAKIAEEDKEQVRSCEDETRIVQLVATLFVVSVAFVASRF